MARPTESHSRSSSRTALSIGPPPPNKSPRLLHPHKSKSAKRVPRGTHKFHQMPVDRESIIVNRSSTSASVKLRYVIALPISCSQDLSCKYYFLYKAGQSESFRYLFGLAIHDVSRDLNFAVSHFTGAAPPRPQRLQQLANLNALSSSACSRKECKELLALQQETINFYLAEPEFRLAYHPQGQWPSVKKHEKLLTLFDEQISSGKAVIKVIPKNYQTYSL